MSQATAPPTASSSTSRAQVSPTLSLVTRSTIEALRCNPSQGSRTNDVFQSVVKGRKSWKTLRGGEVVWPPELEAALIEGLESYQPDDSRETRLLGRFPMRNRFISDYIFEKTGKRRTAKQVGSRLQQLRDTCGGKKLLKLLSPIRRQPRLSQPLSPELYPTSGLSRYPIPQLGDDDESASEGSLASPPATPTDPHHSVAAYNGDPTARQDPLPQTIVYIDLLLDDVSDADVFPCPPADEHGWTERGFAVVRSSQHPRRLQEIDPMITLVSRSPTSAVSFFTVYADDTVVFEEITSLISLGPTPNSNDGFLYSTTLVPGFWEKLSQSSDPTQYSVVQRVIEEKSNTTIFSAMYKFNYPSSISSNLYQSFPMPQSTPHNCRHRDDARIVQPGDHSPLEVSFDSLLAMDPDSNFPNIVQPYEKSNAFYYDDVGAFLKNAVEWSACSPTTLSASTSSECDDLLSPSSATFPTNISNYAL